MKKLFSFLTFFIIINGISNAQLSKVDNNNLEIGKITPGGIKTIYLVQSGDTFTFHYKDAKYQQLEEWKSFTIESRQDLDDFYKMVMDGFKEVPKDDVMIESPNGYIFLKYRKFLGKPVLSFAFSDNPEVIGFSNEYTEKQVKKLFGK